MEQSIYFLIVVTFGLCLGEIAIGILKRLHHKRGHANAHRRTRSTHTQ